MTYTKILKNEIVNQVGMRPLSEVELMGLQGIEGDPAEARIADLEVFGGVPAQLVLCDGALGLYYADENDDLHGWQANLPRLVAEIIAARLLTWVAGQHVELTEDLLQRLGFESVF